MIRHLVMLRWRDAGARDGIVAALADLAKLPGVLSFRVIENVSPETAVVHGFRDGFAFDFADAAARDAYLAHPTHVAVGTRIVAACGVEGVQVVDWEV